MFGRSEMSLGQLDRVNQYIDACTCARGAKEVAVIKQELETKDATIERLEEEIRRKDGEKDNLMAVTPRTRRTQHRLVSQTTLACAAMPPLPRRVSGISPSARRIPATDAARPDGPDRSDPRGARGAGPRVGGATLGRDLPAEPRARQRGTPRGEGTTEQRRRDEARTAEPKPVQGRVGVGTGEENTSRRQLPPTLACPGGEGS